MRRQRGVTYFWALLLIVLIALGLGKLLQNARTLNQRTREADLLYIGNIYRSAIRHYALSTPIGAKPYPEKLDDLIRDPRYPVVRRYLRQLYPDPVTAKPFVPIYSPEGGIMGVHSPSRARPRKEAGFQPDQASFANARSYEEWQFVYVP